MSAKSVSHASVWASLSTAVAEGTMTLLPVPYVALQPGPVSNTLGSVGKQDQSAAAYGIDQAAHRGALAAEGTTVAVLACGVDVAYPRGNDRLLARTAESGL